MRRLHRDLLDVIEVADGCGQDGLGALGLEGCEAVALDRGGGAIRRWFGRSWLTSCSMGGRSAAAVPPLGDASSANRFERTLIPRLYAGMPDTNSAVSTTPTSSVGVAPACRAAVARQVASSAWPSTTSWPKCTRSWTFASSGFSVMTARRRAWMASTASRRPGGSVDRHSSRRRHGRPRRAASGVEVRAATLRPSL